MTHRCSDQGVAGSDILRRGRAHLASAAVDGRDHGALSCCRQRHQCGILARCLHHKITVSRCRRSLPSRTVSAATSNLVQCAGFPKPIYPMTAAIATHVLGVEQNHVCCALNNEW